MVDAILKNATLKQKWFELVSSVYHSEITSENVLKGNEELQEFEGEFSSKDPVVLLSAKVKPAKLVDYVEKPFSTKVSKKRMEFKPLGPTLQKIELKGNVCKICLGRGHMAKCCPSWNKTENFDRLNIFIQSLKGDKRTEFELKHKKVV
ncbi:hypothetical protein EIN_497330 [Entamoeba invadens IP1]|uniref:CCHC-type domain-containing protein n=1 Tax=Entamoeba invadens IP1 TaxID=370355 RepID=A0A0A1UH32_ENTIV|nr:hypothetical protein EIN_497330 [Entamoeba invadens IP1]ELP94583.1 hypothetical protein EIN_497330 [Entamoeba invadens IP1]|eukprot:XP_004261354.1 hypothetical protein EIN_497330 [Entamoeba invadens IP1]